VKFRFIKGHLAGHYPLEACCDVLGVSRSGYYAWRDRPRAARAGRREELAAKVRAVHGANRGVYGSPRVCAALRASGEAVSENTVAKVMRERGIRAKAKRKFVPRTTDSAHQRPVADNVLAREFDAPLPDRKWAADITHVPTAQGWLYLAAVIDLCSRRVVGWAMADHLRATLCSEALEMALSRRNPPADRTLVHHSDRGVQYACGDYRGLLRSQGIECSMSRRGDCYDNAVVESFFKTLKAELVYHERYATREQARRSVFEYVEVFYNRRRLHSSLDYRSPVEFERDIIAAA